MFKKVHYLKKRKIILVSSEQNVQDAITLNHKE